MFTHRYPDAARECQRCSRECALGCIGEGPQRCLDGLCKNVIYGTTCLNTCPDGWYWRDSGTDMETRVCKGECGSLACGPQPFWDNCLAWRSPLPHWLHFGSSDSSTSAADSNFFGRTNDPLPLQSAPGAIFVTAKTSNRVPILSFSRPRARMGALSALSSRTAVASATLSATQTRQSAVALNMS